MKVSSVLCRCVSRSGSCWSRPVGSAGHRGAGGGEAAGHAAVDDLVADPDDETAADVRVEGAAHADRPSVQVAEGARESVLLLLAQRHGRYHPGDRAVPVLRGPLEQVVDGELDVA